MAWTQAMIDELQTAMASGVLTVNYSGPPARSITYQSLAAMQSQLAVMQQAVSRAAGGTTYKLAKYRKGFDS